MISQFQAKYYAHELGRRYPSDSPEKLAGALVDAQVDLNPHQVEAALFAFRSPLSKGALLADEVGLGKTIEAGLVLSQKWAERNRRILIITPSNLRKQWHQELQEKFFLPCQLLEAKSYNAAIKLGNFKPFEIKDKIVICSYQFARSKAADVNAIRWDLVVIDEAHRLRNVYKPANVVANTDEGILLDEDSARRMMSLTVRSKTPIETIDSAPLQAFTERRKTTIKQTISERNGKFFEEEAAKLDGWAEDLKITLERDIKDMDRQIREAKRAATLALTLEEKLAGQKQIKNLEGQRNTKRRTLFDAQDEIDLKRETLIAGIEQKLLQSMTLKEVFGIRWRLV